LNGPKKIWDHDKIRSNILAQLELIAKRDIEAPGDMAGGGCPTLVSVLWVLQKLSDENFYGKIVIQSKGGKTLKPSIAEQSFRFDEEFPDLLL
jgi:hypothetical protein